MSLSWDRAVIATTVTRHFHLPQQPAKSLKRSFFCHNWSCYRFHRWPWLRH